MMFARAQKQFTGWHMLVVMVLFFGTVISVNIVMAIYANTSWTGLVVQNTYVASQEFNSRAEAGRAQAAKGWKTALELQPGLVRFALTDATGAAIHPKGVTATFRRPAYEAEDQTIALKPLPGGAYRAEQTIRDGIWIVEVDADIGEALPYRDVRRIIVKEGVFK